MIIRQEEELNKFVLNSSLRFGEEKLISELIIELIAENFNVFVIDAGYNLSSTIKFLDGKLIIVDQQNITSTSSGNCSISSLTVFEFAKLISDPVDIINETIERVLNQIALLFSNNNRKNGFVVMILVPELIWHLPIRTLKRVMSSLLKNRGKLMLCKQNFNNDLEVVVI